MATILRSRVAWTKPRDPTETRRSSDLTPEEQANVKTALRFLAKRQGTYQKLAAAMRVNRETLKLAAHRGRVSAGVALRAARAAGVPMEDVLGGRWPAAGTCPHCGRA
jgi:hypothetical protein